MAEQRKKTDSILLRAGGKTLSLELFPSGEWPEENGGQGLFRVRINDAWHCPAGKYSFLTRAAIGELVAALLNGGEVPEEESAPYLPEGSDVKVYLDDTLSGAFGVIKVPPYQRRDGRWRVQVRIPGRTAEFLCNDVTLLRAWR